MSGTSIVSSSVICFTAASCASLTCILCATAEFSGHYTSIGVLDSQPTQRTRQKQPLNHCYQHHQTTNHYLGRLCCFGFLCCSHPLQHKLLTRHFTVEHERSLKTTNRQEHTAPPTDNSTQHHRQTRAHSTTDKQEHTAPPTNKSTQPPP